jgi:hypothetical protein
MSGKNNGTPTTPITLGAGSSYVVNTTVALSRPVPFGHAKAGEVRVSTGITSLTWHSATTYDGTYRPCYDAANAAVVQTVTDARAHSLPAALFGRLFVKAVPNTNGTIEVVTQT